MRPSVDGIVETAIYVADTNASAEFYERVLGLRRMGGSERLIAMNVSDRHVLLLFKKGGSRQATVIEGGVIPPTDAEGHIHFALSISIGSVEAWREWLTSQGVSVESEVSWERGGCSLYFRDLDGHNVELATPGIWEIY